MKRVSFGMRRHNHGQCSVTSGSGCGMPTDSRADPRGSNRPRAERRLREGPFNDIAGRLRFDVRKEIALSAGTLFKRYNSNRRSPIAFPAQAISGRVGRCQDHWSSYRRTQRDHGPRLALARPPMRPYDPQVVCGIARVPVARVAKGDRSVKLLAVVYKVYQLEHPHTSTAGRSGAVDSPGHGP